MAATTNNAWPIPVSTDYVKNGYAAIDDLGNAIDTSVGTGLLAWTSWAPTLSGGWSAGNGTFDAKYCKIGKTVHVSFQFTLGSTTTKGTSFTTTLPVTGRVGNGSTAPVRLVRSATYYGIVTAGTTTAVITALNSATSTVSSAAVSSTVPGTWATGDSITFTVTYEAA